VGRHSGAVRRNPWGIAVLALIGIMTLAVTAVSFSLWRSGGADDAAGPAATTPPPVECATPVKVVTAASFAPVLSALKPAIAVGPDCARLEIKVADGRNAARHIGHLGADVWIPDDTAWATVAGGAFAKAVPEGGPVIVATSPLYFVTDRTTARTLTTAGTSWIGLANLVSADSGVRPVMRDPAGSGDGLIAAGALGEAVWIESGMDVSAEALADAVAVSRTVAGSAPARPDKTREVGLVPEYALLRQGWPEDKVVLAPADHTAQLRYTWLPAANAARNQNVARAMDRLLRTLRGADAAPQLAAAGLRGHTGGSVQSVETRRLPPMAAKPFAVLEPHHIDHVFASWYPADRRSDVLVVVDVSGSMNEPTPGTTTPLIRTVAGGCVRLGTLLPNDARLALWEFGSLIDPPRDYRPLLPLRALTPAHRKALGTASGALKARPTGTGLYDTVLAAYLSARNSYRRGTPNQVVLFTDGLNQDDPGAISGPQLTAALKKAIDPKRPVQLSVITFGQPESQADALGKLLEPIDGNVEPLKSASEVDALFIHVAAGGLEHGR